MFKSVDCYWVSFININLCKISLSLRTKSETLKYAIKMYNLTKDCALNFRLNTSNYDDNFMTREKTTDLDAENKSKRNPPLTLCCHGDGHFESVSALSLTEVK